MYGPSIMHLLPSYFLGCPTTPMHVAVSSYNITLMVSLNPVPPDHGKGQGNKDSACWSGSLQRGFTASLSVCASACTPPPAPLLLPLLLLFLILFRRGLILLSLLSLPSPLISLHPLNLFHPVQISFLGIFTWCCHAQFLIVMGIVCALRRRRLPKLFMPA